MSTNGFPANAHVISMSSDSFNTALNVKFKTEEGASAGGKRLNTYQFEIHDIYIKFL